MKQRREKTAQEITGVANSRSGSLERNNVYSTDAVRDWAARIHCGPTGLRMNEKYLLEVMAASCNPRGVCELPVRFLSDRIGVGMRQAQRIIQRLIRYELVSALDVHPHGRPIDVVRKFLLRTVIDADTWENKTSTEVPLMRRMREELNARLVAALSAGKISDLDFLTLGSVHLVSVESKRLNFVASDAEVTNTVFRYAKVFLDLASTATNSQVLKLHLIPRKGYRG